MSDIGGEVQITPTILREASGDGDLQRAVHINLHNQNIVAIEGLDVVPKLRILDLSFNKISRIEGLADVPQLKELKLYNNQIEAIGGLERASALQVLHLEHNKIWGINLGLDHCRALRTLFVGNNRISVLEGLDKLTGLSSFDASDNEIDKIQGLTNLVTLEELNLRGNNIKQIEGLQHCGQLRELVLCDNQISHLKGMSKLPNLDVLRINGNLLKTLDGLSKSLKNLTEVYLARNELVSVEGLAQCCPAIEILDVTDNRLSSVKRAVAGLVLLPELVELSLSGNPLATGNEKYRTRICLGLPKLQFLDEHEVTVADRYQADLPPNSLPGDSVAVGSEFDPTQEEMLAYMRKMNISTQVNAHLGRPSTSSSRPSSSRPGSASRPGTSVGSDGSDSARGPNPMMMRRPPSARTGGGKRLPSADEFESCASDFKVDPDACSLSPPALWPSHICPFRPRILLT
ncbi:hypothetical protein CYMTET_26266 [Cymbomonas tetramitiformis]|uniref:Protein phosphatase 1 regulatory subunit 7 n=1 Tax=Cymbomonas tetramitiformis TaxID=36881 RepID=A0AAE0KYC1_9CHLO|nr:hypothetical protein CYMTET_26266 [Cymbomonas tetramitiformis]